ncbi:hypothetical protein [Thermococcus sp.]|uniref:hypothetical protein n=1 Tax=Thermococcus sp. TaxID=35749 RepID=UPI00261E3848|nr:hypothetical protein [Thermococcus sp.]
MEGWAKKVGAVLLLAMLLSLQFGTVQETKALTDNSSVTFRRAVVAWYDERGRLQMNVTWVNKTIDFANLTNSSCACHNSSSCTSNLTANFNVSVVTLYNMTKKHEQLLFFGITLYNETFNYTMYALVYRAERSQYNFTLVTKILTDKLHGGYWIYLTTMNIAPNDENKVVPVGDTIVTKDNLTLSEYYWTLNKVLMKLRRGDETNWVWGRSAYELRHLSHLVRLRLHKYDRYETIGVTVSMDSLTACEFPLNPLISIKFICTQPKAPSWVIVGACCGVLYGIVITCTAACLTGTGCLACIAAGAFGSWGALAGCYGYCPSMQVCIYTLGFIKVKCGTLW